MVWSTQTAVTTLSETRSKQTSDWEYQRKAWEPGDLRDTNKPGAMAANEPSSEERLQFVATWLEAVLRVGVQLIWNQIPSAGDLRSETPISVQLSRVASDGLTWLISTLALTGLGRPN
jgi:hypothetical protein